MKLSDEDCMGILERAGEHGLTVAELLENFIGDLVEGKHSNGSDEREFADRWFKRCWFAYPEDTLLHYLLVCEYDPKKYLDTLNNIENAEIELNKYHNEEDFQYLKEDIADWKEELEEIIEDWNPEEPNMKEEIDQLKKWVKEYQELIWGINNVV